VIVDQVLCAAGPVDAVTNQALACRELFTSWGWGGSDYAPVIAHGMPAGRLRRLSELPADGEGVLLLHYSGWAEGLERVFDGSRRALLISHNITPSRYFWDHEPLQAVHNELAHEQLAELIRTVDLVAGVSHYNAGELRELGAADPLVIPVLVDRQRLGSPEGRPQAAATDSVNVLFVGRVVPHKRQDLVIRAVGRLRERVPGARLALVGVPMSPGYRAGMHQLAQRVAPGAVDFHETIEPPALAELYRRADVFLCLSEHEGFCIPLLEAMHFGVPVIARDAGAVGEVLGDAGVLLEQHDGIEVVAELIRIVAGDAELREELRRRGRERLAHYDRAGAAEQLRRALEGLAA
jgi:glycosyltransferase involved in cell wall biosynthesis